MSTGLLIYDGNLEAGLGHGHMGMRYAGAQEPRHFESPENTQGLVGLRPGLSFATDRGATWPDLSMFVQVTNWPQFNARYPVAAVKLSEGASYRDPYAQEFLRNYTGFPLCYHFLRLETSIAAQVANFAGALPRNRACGIALDVETSGAQTNPSVEQASLWLTSAQTRLARPRATFASYMPRWWYAEHGGGSTSLRDTLCWLSDYRRSPDLGPYAGWQKIDILQFGSTISGSGMPAGDMNIAFDRSFTQLRAVLTGAAADKEHDVSKKDVEDALKERYSPEQQTPIEALEGIRGRFDSLQGYLAWMTTAIGARFDAIDAALDIDSAAAAQAAAGDPPKVDE